MQAEERCKFTKADGTRCRTTFGINPETGYCWHHDPQKEEERRVARAKGGKHAAIGRRPWASSDVVPGDRPTTAQEAQEWASWLVTATAQGWVSTEVSQRISTAINTFLRAQSQASMERKIMRLEAQVKELKRER